MLLKIKRIWNINYKRHHLVILLALQSSPYFLFFPSHPTPSTLLTPSFPVSSQSSPRSFHHPCSPVYSPFLPPLLLTPVCLPSSAPRSTLVPPLLSSCLPCHSHLPLSPPYHLSPRVLPPPHRCGRSFQPPQQPSGRPPSTVSGKTR